VRRRLRGLKCTTYEPPIVVIPIVLVFPRIPIAIVCVVKGISMHQDLKLLFVVCNSVGPTSLYSSNLSLADKSTSM